MCASPALVESLLRPIAVCSSPGPWVIALLGKGRIALRRACDPVRHQHPRNSPQMASHTPKLVQATVTVVETAPNFAQAAQFLADTTPKAVELAQTWSTTPQTWSTRWCAECGAQLLDWRSRAADWPLQERFTRACAVRGAGQHHHCTCACQLFLEKWKWDEALQKHADQTSARPWQSAARRRPTPKERLSTERCGKRPRWRVSEEGT